MLNLNTNTHTPTNTHLHTHTHTPLMWYICCRVWYTVSRYHISLLSLHNKDTQCTLMHLLKHTRTDIHTHIYTLTSTFIHICSHAHNNMVTLTISLSKIAWSTSLVLIQSASCVRAHWANQNWYWFVSFGSETAETTLKVTPWKP